MGVDDPGASEYLLDEGQSESFEHLNGMWTRVFTRASQSSGLSPSFAIGDDIQFDQAMRAALYQMETGTGQALFSPYDID